MKAGASTPRTTVASIDTAAVTPALQLGERCLRKGRCHTDNRHQSGGRGAPVRVSAWDRSVVLIGPSTTTSKRPAAVTGNTENVTDVTAPHCHGQGSIVGRSRSQPGGRDTEQDHQGALSVEHVRAEVG